MGGDKSITHTASLYKFEHEVMDKPEVVISYWELYFPGAGWSVENAEYTIAQLAVPEEVKQAFTRKVTQVATRAERMDPVRTREKEEERDKLEEELERQEHYSEAAMQRRRDRAQQEQQRERELAQMQKQPQLHREEQAQQQATAGGARERGPEGKGTERWDRPGTAGSAHGGGNREVGDDSTILIADYTGQRKTVEDWGKEQLMKEGQLMVENKTIKSAREIGTDIIKAIVGEGVDKELSLLLPILLDEGSNYGTREGQLGRFFADAYETRIRGTIQTALRGAYAAGSGADQEHMSMPLADRIIKEAAVDAWADGMLGAKDLGMPAEPMVKQEYVTHVKDAKTRMTKELRLIMEGGQTPTDPDMAKAYKGLTTMQLRKMVQPMTNAIMVTRRYFVERIQKQLMTFTERVQEGFQELSIKNATAAAVARKVVREQEESEQRASQLTR